MLWHNKKCIVFYSYFATTLKYVYNEIGFTYDNFIWKTRKKDIYPFIWFLYIRLYNRCEIINQTSRNDLHDSPRQICCQFINTSLLCSCNLNQTYLSHRRVTIWNDCQKIFILCKKYYANMGYLFTKQKLQ